MSTRINFDPLLQAGAFSISPIQTPVVDKSKIPVLDDFEAYPNENTWLRQLGRLINDEQVFLKLKSSSYDKKNEMFAELEKIYLRVMGVWDNEMGPLSQDERKAIVSTIASNVNSCMPGFHDRIAFVAASLAEPKNLDQMLYCARKELIESGARARLPQLGLNEGVEVHAHNDFFIGAFNLGFGILPPNPSDIHKGYVSEDTLNELLLTITDKYQAIKLPYLLTAESGVLRSMLNKRGYTGYKQFGYSLKVISDISALFVMLFINPADIIAHQEKLKKLKQQLVTVKNQSSALSGQITALSGKRSTRDAQLLRLHAQKSQAEASEKALKKLIESLRSPEEELQARFFRLTEPHTQNDEDDDNVYDLNWPEINRALYNKLVAENAISNQTLDFNYATAKTLEDYAYLYELLPLKSVKRKEACLKTAAHLLDRDITANKKAALKNQLATIKNISPTYYYNLIKCYFSLSTERKLNPNLLIFLAQNQTSKEFLLLIEWLDKKCPEDLGNVIRGQKTEEWASLFHVFNYQEKPEEFLLFMQLLLKHAADRIAATLDLQWYYNLLVYAAQHYIEPDRLLSFIQLFSDNVLAQTLIQQNEYGVNCLMVATQYQTQPGVFQKILQILASTAPHTLTIASTQENQYGSNFLMLAAAYQTQPGAFQKILQILASTAPHTLTIGSTRQNQYGSNFLMLAAQYQTQAGVLYESIQTLANVAPDALATASVQQNQYGSNFLMLAAEYQTQPGAFVEIIQSTTPNALAAALTQQNQSGSNFLMLAATHQTQPGVLTAIIQRLSQCAPEALGEALNQKDSTGLDFLTRICQEKTPPAVLQDILQILAKNAPAELATTLALTLAQKNPKDGYALLIKVYTLLGSESPKISQLITEFNDMTTLFNQIREPVDDSNYSKSYFLKTQLLENSVKTLQKKYPNNFQNIFLKNLDKHQKTLSLTMLKQLLNLKNITWNQPVLLKLKQMIDPLEETITILKAERKDIFFALGQKLEIDSRLLSTYSEKLTEKPGDLLLDTAVKTRDISLVKALIELGEKSSEEGVKALLMLAISSDDPVLLHMLVQKNICPISVLNNNELSSGLYPIHIAAQYGYKAVLQALIEFGCDTRSKIHLSKKKSSFFNKTVNISITPLDIAFQHCRFDVMNILFAHDTDSSANFSGIIISPQNLLAFLPGLKQNKQLRSLDLTGNPLGAEGGSYLLELLETNRTLHEIVLLDTNIPKDTIARIETLALMSKLYEASMMTKEPSTMKKICEIEPRYLLLASELDELLRTQPRDLHDRLTRSLNNFERNSSWRQIPIEINDCIKRLRNNIIDTHSNLSNGKQPRQG